MRLANPALALVGALLLAGCSAGDADPTDPTPAAGTATAQAPDPTAEAEPADFGDPGTAACGLLTDEEAQELLEFPMTDEPTGDHLEVLGTGNCTWSAADGLDFRSIQVIVNRSAWISEEAKEMNPDVSARWYWDVNTAESTGPDGETIEPLFDTSRPGPDGLGVQSYYGPLGLCVLESDDLYWCVSAGGLGADLENPEAVSIMEQMATLVDGRIDA